MNDSNKIIKVHNILQKLEPHIKGGLSNQEACKYCNIPQSSFYYYAKKYKWFLERIGTFRTYRSILLVNIFNHYLFVLHEKYMVEHIELNPNEWKFLKWLATHDKSFNDIYGKSVSSVDTNYNPYRNVSEVIDNLEIEVQKGNNSPALTPKALASL